MTPVPESPRVDLDELAALEEQRDFLLRSLEDLDREHEVGDLDAADYETLKADYTTRAARVIDAIRDRHELIDATDPGHRGIRRLIVVGAVALVAAVAGLVVTNTSGSTRQDVASPGTLIPSKETQACIDKMGATFGADAPAADFASEAVATLKCFTARIEADPKDAVAYTYRARTESLVARKLDGIASAQDVANFSTRAKADLAKALKLKPDFADALAFSAMDALDRGDRQSAKTYLERIDRLQLPADNPMLPLVNNAIRPAVHPDATTTSTAAAGTMSGPQGP